MIKNKSIAILVSILVFTLAISFFLFKSSQGDVSKTAIVYNPISLNHNRPGEPESALRLKSIIDELKNQNTWNQVYRMTARPATEDELRLVHEPDYIESVKKLSQKNSPKFLNSDKWAPYNGEYSYQSAITAVGGLIDLSEAVARGEFENGFAIVRPPGHHALKNKGMGFCIFNNIAIASKNLINKKLAQRILIFDIDAHHGNGIEEAFNGSSEVVYISLHQNLIFPYTGDVSSENIKNIKLNFLETEENYKKYFEVALNKAIEKFKPDFIFVSAGYDAHWRDYMSNLGLTSTGHFWLSEKLVESAAIHSNKKIVFSLEGGYDLEALSQGVSNSLKALLHRKDFSDTIGKAPHN